MILGRGDWFSGGLPSRILRRGWLPYHSFSPKIWRIHPGVQGGKPGSNSVSGSKPPMVTSISAPNGREHHNSNARAFHRRGCEKISIMSIQSRVAYQVPTARAACGRRTTLPPITRFSFTKGVSRKSWGRRPRQGGVDSPPFTEGYNLPPGPEMAERRA